MNINQILADSIEKLKEKKIITPQLDAELLLGFILKKPREYVMIHPEHQLTKLQETGYKKILQRRLKHEPIAYILGQKEFYGLNFKVNKHTLIPRPETEHLVDAVISNLQLVNSKKIIIADIGTGSGNIIISIAKNNEQQSMSSNKIKYFGIDISEKVLAIAKKNSKIHKLNNKIKFIKSDLLKYFIDHCSLITDHCIIIANLPYLSKKIYFSAMPDVKNFEPKSALLSGMDGLDHYEKLFKQLKKILLITDHCSLILEISPEQKKSITKLIKKYFPNAHIEFQKDLAQKWRVVKLFI
ncbi:MAG: peptide chain release factor N(5)-glutamine methyltransferase [bacterium]|nr:peptide chain release factor N(5)-glutamine methyltransferase [bacterium]